MIQLRKITLLKGFEMDYPQWIHSVRHVTAPEASEFVRLIVRTNEFLKDAYLTVDGVKCEPFTNREEPFAPYTHGFLLSKERLASNPDICFFGTAFTSEGVLAGIPVTDADARVSPIAYLEQDEETHDALAHATDSGYRLLSKEESDVADGLHYTRLHLQTKTGAPVEAFLLCADPSRIGFEMGLTGDGAPMLLQSEREDRSMLRYPISTVESMATCAIREGLDVCAAVNADFFDMFGDNHPAGLCVKGGRVVANAESKRPFFAVTDGGAPVIADFSEHPEHQGHLRFAVSGLHVLLRDGKPFDLAFCEPFGEVAHPRTAVGIRADGTVLILVVDGRVPTYSNGATLADVAELLRSHGAVDALNLDGGGSSICLLRPDGSEGFVRVSRPADLMRPDECLIREGYNSVLLYRKKKAN